jgi:hypothetical protein
VETGARVQELSFGLRLLAGVMRRMPTGIRRVDLLWHALYRRLGGGTYTEDATIDLRWPAGLQPGVRGTLHGQLMRLNLQDWSDRRAYFSGRYYQQDISRLLLTVLRPGDQYLDVGANIGMTTLIAASSCACRCTCSKTASRISKPFPRRWLTAKEWPNSMCMDRTPV